MNPYKSLPDKSFWKLAIANKSMFDIEGLWDPKFQIKPKHNVVTFGSCFAQHIGKALKSRNFKWLVTETAPNGLKETNKKQYNYDVFSARTGNIYTTSLLLQWTEWALGIKEPPKEIWKNDGRYFDPFRPAIEPNGFATSEELFASRTKAIDSFKQCIEKASFFVFTLGLTESWFNKEGEYEYPMCPGTVAGNFDAKVHIFENQSFNKIQRNLNAAISLMKTKNTKLKFILTVSPVPLTATKSGKHVLTATMASKSVLRAVAEQLSSTKKYIDYFPSYEIINSPVFKGTFFEPNQRGVNPYGVNFVMDSFFKCLNMKYNYLAPTKPNNRAIISDAVCEEELLGAFKK